jgi:hypothetical protein
VLLVCLAGAAVSKLPSSQAGHSVLHLGSLWVRRSAVLNSEDLVFLFNNLMPLLLLCWRWLNVRTPPRLEGWGRSAVS